MRGNPGIPRGAHQLADVAVGGKPGDQRVLARAAAEDQNSHDLKRFSACEQDAHGWRGRGLFR